MDSLSQMHPRLLEEGMTGGIEVVNGGSFYEEALEIAFEQDLAILGNSEVHGLVDWSSDVQEDGHLPVTLVFAVEKSEEAIKEAMENARTAVWFQNTLIGKPEFLVPFIQNSLKADREEEERNLTVRIENQSDADYILDNRSDYSFTNHAGILVMKAHETAELRIKTRKELPSFELRFSVLNALMAHGKHPEISLKVE